MKVMEKEGGKKAVIHNSKTNIFSALIHNLAEGCVEDLGEGGKRQHWTVMFWGGSWLFFKDYFLMLWKVK